MVSKKGTLRDVVFLASGGFLGLFIVLLLVAFVGNQVIEKLEDSGVLEGNDDAGQVINDTKNFITNYDKLAIAGFIGTILIFIITSWLVAGHPLGMIAYFIGGMLAVMISMMVSNLWESITAQQVLLSTAALFPFANHIMLRLPFYIRVIWFIGIVITFVKHPKQEFGGFA